MRNAVDIKTLVTPSYTHSPGLVRTAFRVGLQNAGVSVAVVETVEFPELRKRYVVEAVPTTVLNEAPAMPGATLIDVRQRTLESKPIRTDMSRGPITQMAATPRRDEPNAAPASLTMPR